MKCTAVGCKCEATVLISMLWGKESEMAMCDKHLPTWAKSKRIGLYSPVVSLFGQSKSFYRIKALL